MKSTSFFLALLAAPVSLSGLSNASEAQRPIVLLIVTADMNQAGQRPVGWKMEAKKVSEEPSSHA
jgi:hypothetical protein